MNYQITEEPVRPRMKTNGIEDLRKLWGLDDEDEFGAEQGRPSEEQEMFDENAAQGGTRGDEKDERRGSWEKHGDGEEGEHPRYRSTEPRPSNK